MTKQGLYKFQDGTSTGVELVPINGYIFIEDTGGSNKSIMIIDKSGITSATTIDQLLALTSQWVDIGSSGGGVVIPSDMDIIRLRHTTSLSVDSTSPVDITWDTQEEISDSFTFSGSEITIVETGTYQLSAGVNYSTSIDRYNSRVTVIVNGTPLPDYFQGSYARSTGTLPDTGVTATLSLSLTAGDKVKVATQAMSGTTSTDAVLTNGTNVSMIHLTGEKGADGADGQEGAAGSGEGIPIGGIIMYNGAFSAIPANYNVCDGANGTPDLRGQFILGATIEGDIGIEGGTNDVELPRHSHTSDSHNHGVTIDSYQHAHRGLKNSNNNNEYLTDGLTFYSSTAATVQNDTLFSTNTLSTSGLYQFDTAGDTHAHTNTVSNATPIISSEGSIDTPDNRPEFYTLAYIRRMS